MERDFLNFKETIESVVQQNLMTDDVRLVLRGRIEYAAERGDISIKQLRELEALLGADFALRSDKASMLAGMGFIAP